MAHIEIDSDGFIVVHDCYEERKTVGDIGGAWDGINKVWRVIFTAYNLEYLLDNLADLSVPEGLETLVERQVEKERKLLEIREMSKQDIPVSFKIQGLKVPLRNYQKLGVMFSATNESGVLNGDVMGTGKTIQGIATALYLRTHRGISNVLIVTPASLKYNWPIEIEKFTDEKYVVIDGTGGERMAQWLQSDVFFYIVNYELIVEDLFGGRKFKEKEDETAVDRARRTSMAEKAKQRERILAPMRRRVWGAIIIDEAQAIKSHGARRSVAMKSLHANFRMALTGTPMDGRLEELHSIMGFVAPGLLGSKSRFFQRHIQTDFYGKVTGYKHLGEVTKRIEPFFIRRLKQDVLKELPDKIYENKIITLSPEEMKIYKELAKGGHEATADEEAIVAVIRCKQFCDYPPMIDDSCTKTSKMDALKEILDEVVIQNGHKALIFSQYKTMLDFMVPVLDGMGLKYFRIDGDTPPKERAAIQQKFNTDSGVDLVIGTDAMAFGLNLTGADHVFNFDDSWSPSTMEQRADRCHRIGQKSVVTAISFICRGTIEEKIRVVLAAKSKITAEVLGDTTDEMVLSRLGPKDICRLL